MQNLSNRLAGLMVFGALTAALILAVAHGAEKGSTWYLKSALIIGLVCVAIGEFLSWHNAATAWHERRAGSMFLWSILGGLLSVGTLYTNFSSAASNNDGVAVLQRTAFVKRTNVEEELTAAKRARDDLQKRLELTPIRTAEQAQAYIENAMAHKFWKSTSECKETKGPQTRQFCSDYASAVADKAGATAAITMREELKVAIAAVKRYEANQDSGSAVVSDEAPNVGLIKAGLNVSSVQARHVDAMVLPFLVQAMLLFGGILLANEHFRGKTPRPWINWNAVGSAWAKLYKLVTGNDLGPGNTVVIDERNFLAVRQALGHAMRA